METKRLTYFAVDVPDKPGELAKFSKKLKEANLNLSGLWGFGVGQGKARIFCVPQDGARVKGAMEKAGIQAKEGNCFFLTGEDRPGALVDTLDRIASSGLNIHALDAIALGGRYGAYLWVDEKDVEKFSQILKPEKR